MKGIIYKYTSPSNKVYIGQTINEDKRKQSHRLSINSKTKTLFIKAIKKYGFDNLKYEVLTIIESEEDDIYEQLNILESFYIKKYNSTDKKLGYNLTTGGLNCKITEEVKDNISKSKSKHKIYQYSIEGDLLEEFNSRRDIAKKYDNIKIDRCNKQKIVYSSGFQWSYYKFDKIEPYKSLAERTGKKIICINTNTLEEIEYNSIEEASRNLNINSKRISDVLHNRKKSTKGFKFYNK